MTTRRHSRFSACKRILSILILLAGLVLSSACGNKSDRVVYDFLDNVPLALMESNRADGRRVKTWPLNLQMNLREFIYQPSGTRLTYFLEIPPASSLRFGVGMDMVSWQKTRGVDLSIIVTPEGGNAKTVFSLHVNPHLNKDQAGWIDRKISMKEFSGKIVRVEFLSQSYLDPEDDARVGWSRPILVQHERVLEPDSAPRSEQYRPSPQEDVVWFILENMQAVSVGAWGDSTHHTPNIDLFCRQSLQIEGCVAPSTLNYRVLGSLLTARYSIDHGLTRRTRSYATSVRTLATTLRNAPQPYCSFYTTTRSYTKDPFSPAQDFSGCRFIQPELAMDSRETGPEHLASRQALFTGTNGEEYSPSVEVLLLENDSASRKGLGAANNLRKNTAGGKTMPPKALALSEIDSLFGTIVSGLSTRKGKPSPVIILSAIPENWGKGQKNLVAAHKSLGLGRIVTPLALNLPALATSRGLLTGYVSGCDVAPTLFDYLGVQASATLDGLSFLDYCRKDRNHIPAKVLFVDYLPHQASMISWPWKINYFLVNESSHFEIFQIEKDPREREPVDYKDNFALQALCQSFRERLINRRPERENSQIRDQQTSAWFAMR